MGSQLASILFIGVVFFLSGGLWYGFYMRYGELFLGRRIARLMRIDLEVTENGLWSIQFMPEDSDDWRTALLRTLQMIFRFGALLFALVLGIIIFAALTQGGQAVNSR
jgi:hypothetical protein